MRKLMAVAAMATLVVQGFSESCGDAGCSVDHGPVGKAPKVCAVSADSLKTFGDKVSYSIGLSIAKQLNQQMRTMPNQINPNLDGEINTDLVLSALVTSITGKKTVMTEEERASVMAEFETTMRNAQMKQRAEMESMGASAKKDGEEFLAANKSKKDITTTPSGLQYTVLKQGTGAKPAATDEVEVHYHGTLINGTVFDSSVQRGEPIKFALNRVIPGWTEGVQLMNTGSKYRFFIPSDLAYGPRGGGSKIPPNSALVFEVELISIVK